MQTFDYHLFVRLRKIEKESCFAWTGKTFGLFAVYNWPLTEANEQTIVLVEEGMEGFFAKLLKKSFHKNLAKGMTTWVDLLKNESEK